VVGPKNDREHFLNLYRSAVSVAEEWGPEFHEVAAPGCVLVPSADPFLAADGTRNAARRAGARVTELNGLGHWWMLQDPARGADALEAFWGSIN